MDTLRSATLFACLASAYAQNDKPNFVFVLADDQGWGDVGYNKFKYSHPAYQYDWTYNPPRTPNLDAMAASDSSILFYRFYAGSGVCSPTRSAILTGRTPDRECITGAEGCGTAPAWMCDDPLPLPEPTPTVAEAAKKANYSTIHIGKWHLGDFFFKDSKKPNFAYNKWPVSNPGMHGFDEWHSTEASAPSSTTNCGCEKQWWETSPGCITGGGQWENKAYACTNYWFPLDLDSQHKPTRPMCVNESNGAAVLQQDCVGNLTTKIPGDDSEYIMDVFEEYLTRKTGSEKQPFLAMLWLHTVHEPHPSLPQFFHNYTDAFGDPAGDYLGTITQMDVQIGRLRQMLKDKGVADNTMVWYTADNGPHAAQRDRNKYNALGATNGLRQCKASLYEGGIRTPGIIEWPGVISKHSATWHPAYVSDFLPTVLDVLGLTPEQPTWAADGMSILPLIKALAAAPNTNDTTVRPATHPLVFQLGSQMTIINNNFKILRNPVVGQCDKEMGSRTSGGTFLFNLDTDPTESQDLSSLPQYKNLLANMTQQLEAFADSVTHSQEVESQCKQVAPQPGPSPPAPGVSFAHTYDGAQRCLTISSTGNHPKVLLGDCNGGSKWDVNGSDLTNVAQAKADGNCLKVLMMGTSAEPCDLNVTLTLGKCTGSQNHYAFHYDATTATIVNGKCPEPRCVNVDAGGNVQQGSCTGATTWTEGARVAPSL
eukprot:m.391134 g.391134  ORF g.391134 m.391134 type:complete len:709 (+) comp21070_c0_seq4:212-2338(+)